MHRCLTTPVTELLVLDLPLHEFLVLVRIIITPLTNGTAESDQPVCALYFGHGEYGTMAPQKRQLKSRASQPGDIPC